MFESSQNDNSLPPRRETFLARFRRKTKLAVTGVIFVVVALYGIGQNYYHTAAGVEKKHEVLSEKDAKSTKKPAPRDFAGPYEKALNDHNDKTVRLTPAPDVRVTEDTASGSLPRIAEDGARPWQVYSRPFNTADNRPRIAIVISELGLARGVTDQIIMQMPPVVTLAFNSQSPAVGAWMARARQEGHETLLQVPMEPFDYPRSDPGPDALLATLPKAENISRFLKALKKGSGYIGVTTTYASMFFTDPEKFSTILPIIKERGLMVLDSRAAQRSIVTDMSRNEGVPVATVSRHIDADLDPQAIARALSDLEKTARHTGGAVGIAAPTPVMISQLIAWINGLPERGIALVPLSVMVQR